MGVKVIDIVQLLADRIHQGGYTQRALEDDIYEANQKRIAAEKDRDHWMAARKDAIAAGELMQAEIERLRKWKELVQVMLDKIDQLSNVNIGDAEACIESVHQIRKYFDPNEYPVLKGGE